MANKDLRNWLQEVDTIGELKTIKGAETREEIGGIVDLYMREMGTPAVIFDDVPGFPKGHRVLANILTSVPRINVALGLKPDASRNELIAWWRDYSVIVLNFSYDSCYRNIVSILCIYSE